MELNNVKVFQNEMREGKEDHLGAAKIKKVHHYFAVVFKATLYYR